MAISIQDFRMAIRIDNSEAKAKFEETREQIAKVKEEMDKLAAAGKKDSAEYKELKKQHDALNTSLYGLRKEAGLTSLSYNELRKGARSLKAQMDKETPGTEKWKALRADFLLTKQRMKELEVQARDTRFSLSKVADGFNRYAAMGAGAVASLTGVALTARKCVDEYAEMEEAEAQVIKYTGMTKNEVRELNEEFKQMDTRTAREKLNALAGDAGRLGLKGKKDVLEFVDAADKINVALGEDLGEDAVKNIGKLAQMFGEDEKLGLRGAMLSTGSAINEVAQNSSAAEAYLVGFTARVAGAANQAKVAQGDILGYASVLDQNMQQQEMAATAFQTLMMKMYQEPAKFAKIAGQSVEDFASLIKKDANEAILQFLDTLHKKGGLDQLAPMFKEMGLDGVRASGVISTMAGKIDDIRTAQKLANDAYRDGTSVTKEYNVQNNTVQAELDKAKNAFKNVRVEMGEKLQPVMKYMITTGSLTVKGLSAVISVFKEYKGAILSATTAIAAYTIAVKLSVIWDKTKVLWTDRVVAGLKVLYATAKSHPWGLLIGVLTAVVSYLTIFRNKTVDVTKSIREMNKEMANEQAQMSTLFDALNRANKGSRQRRDILKEINDKYGTYLPNLLTEKSSLDEIESAYQRINKRLQEQIVLKYKNQDVSKVMEDATVKQMDAVESIRQSIVDKLGKNNLSTMAIEDMKQITAEFYRAGSKWQDAFAQAYHSIKVKYYGKNSMSSFAASDMETYIKSYYNMQREINRINQKYDSWMPKDKPANQLDEVIITGGVKKDSPNGKGGNGNGSGSDEELKKEEEIRKQAYQKRLNDLKESYLNEGLTQQKYQQELYQAEINYLLSRKALLEDYGKDTSAIQGQIYDKMIAEANRLANVRKKTEAEEKAAYFSALELKYQEDLQSLKKQYLEGDIKTEKEYQAKMKRLELDYLNERKRMQEEYGDDVLRINGQILDKELKLFQDAKRKKEKLEEKKKEDVKDDFYTRNDDPAVNVVIDGLQLIFATKKQMWETEEEYEERIKGNKLKGIQLVAQATALASAGIQALQEHEINKITRKYDKEIKAAQKAGKDTTKLEEEKEEAINQVKKKYADKQFAAAVLQVTASTAVAAMEAYKAMAGIPIVGPALGAIAAAAAVASGAAQIAVAKQQRDEAKGLKSGGYSDEYVEGYTDNGNPDDVAGVIPVHKNEFVTNHEGVANPHVRQFLDVFDVAQKNGTIRMINTTQILEQVRTHSGKYSGGYTEDVSPSRSFAGNPTEWTPELRSQIVELLQQNNELLAAIRDKDLIVDPRKVRDGIKRVEFLEKNISR